MEQPALAACAKRGSLAVQGMPADTSSSVALLKTQGHTLALVADADQRALATFDLEQARQVAVTPLGATPSQLLVLADGRVAVTLQDANRVALFEFTAIDQPLALRCSTPVPSEPFGLAETHDTLLVTSSWEHQLSALDLTSLSTRYRVSLEREPRAVLALGNRAFVSHVVGGRVSVVDLEGDLHQARRISLDVGGNFSTRKLTQGFALALGRLQGGTRLFAPGAAAFSGNPVISHGYGSFRVRAHLPLVNVIDPTGETSLTRFAHEGAASPDHWDHVSGWGEECILPRAATSAGDKLYVACQGTNTLLELDARAADPIRVESRRFPVPAGPSGVAIASTRAAVWSQFGELALVDLTKSGRGPSRASPAGARPRHATPLSSLGAASSSTTPSICASPSTAAPVRAVTPMGAMTASLGQPQMAHVRASCWRVVSRATHRTAGLATTAIWINTWKSPSAPWAVGA